MPHGDWKLVVTDVAGNEIGELLNATGVRLSFSRNRPITLSFSMRQSDPMVEHVQEGKSRVKAFRNGVLQAYNVVWDCQDEFSVDGSMVQVATASPMFLLSRRYTASETDWTNVTPGTVVRDLVAAQNAIHPTGIRTSATVVPNVGVTSTTAPQYANVLDTITTHLDGWDWLDYAVVPDDSVWVSGTNLMGSLEIYTGQGIDNYEVFFEFGIGKDNLLGVSVQNSMDKLSTDVTVVGKTDDTSAYVSASPSPEYSGPRSEYHAMYQTLETFTDLTTQTFLDSLRVNYHDVRKTPRQLVTFTPNPEGGENFPFDDYNIGDRVTFRLREGRKNIDGSIRIEGFSIELGDTGNERVTEIRTMEE